MARKAGIIRDGERGPRDYFVDRVIFPIRDINGRAVGFGARALRDASRAGRPSGSAGAESRRPALAPGTAFRQGALSNLGNPKMAVFFVSLLPQFIPHGRGAFAAPFALGLVFCSMTLAWLTLYALAVGRAGDFLGRSGIRRGLEGLLGLVLIGLGLRLAAERG